MKTVIIGTDFIYDSESNIKPIEINTNISINANKVENNSDIFDSSELISFINSNSFNKITYVGSLQPMHDFLQSVCNELSITFEYITVSMGAMTIPNIEDEDGTLIIRTAFDTTAILDDEYCANKLNFLNLIKETEFASQFAYRNSDGSIITNITEIKNNNNHPNFILKAISPHYDKTVYPKLYKVENQEELDVVLENLTTDYILMEYHINEDKFYEGSVTKIRKISLLYPPTLQSIHIGAYRDLTLARVNNSQQYDPLTFELDTESRDMYITNRAEIQLPKLLDDDYVVLSDNTLKSGLDLQVGDIVKTINIPNVSGLTIEESGENYNIDVNTFIEGVTYNSNRVTHKKRIDAVVNMGVIVFQDETTWSDTINSRYLVVNDGQVKFKALSKLIAGDIVLLVNTDNVENPVIEQKIVSTLNLTSQMFSGWVITVETTQLFLTKSTGSIVNSPSFAAIEHNDCAVVCGKGQVMTTFGQYMVASSDIRLKKNIEYKYTTLDGLKIYTFEYDNNFVINQKTQFNEDYSGKWKGVMAQDLIGTEFESAVVHTNDYYKVDYSKLNLKLVKINIS